MHNDHVFAAHGAVHNYGGSGTPAYLASMAQNVFVFLLALRTWGSGRLDQREVVVCGFSHREVSVAGTTGMPTCRAGMLLQDDMCRGKLVDPSTG